VTTVCLDKTGTLTKNNMCVSEIQMLSDRLDLECISSSLNVKEYQTAIYLLKITVLCSESTINSVKGTFEGSATENALLECAQKQSIDISSLRALYPMKKKMVRNNQCNIMV
jgi:Ca2+-transporting ATPase